MRWHAARIRTQCQGRAACQPALAHPWLMVTLQLRRSPCGAPPPLLHAAVRCPAAAQCGRVPGARAAHPVGTQPAAQVHRRRLWPGLRRVCGQPRAAGQVGPAGPAGAAGLAGGGAGSPGERPGPQGIAPCRCMGAAVPAGFGAGADAGFRRRARSCQLGWPACRAFGWPRRCTAWHAGPNTAVAPQQSPLQRDPGCSPQPRPTLQTIFPRSPPPNTSAHAHAHMHTRRPPRPPSPALQVKAWAAQADISGAARGRLSSYALTLMCVWHLQMRQPAVLPPLGALFGWRQRPAEGGAHFGLGRVRVGWAAAAAGVSTHAIHACCGPTTAHSWHASCRRANRQFAPHHHSHPSSLAACTQNAKTRTPGLPTRRRAAGCACATCALRGHSSPPTQRRCVSCCSPSSPPGTPRCVPGCSSTSPASALRRQLPARRGTAGLRRPMLPCRLAGRSRTSL